MIAKGIVLYEDDAFLYIGNGEVLKEFHGAGDAFDGMFLARLLQGTHSGKCPGSSCIRMCMYQRK